MNIKDRELKNNQIKTSLQGAYLASSDNPSDIVDHQFKSRFFSASRSIQNLWCYMTAASGMIEERNT